MIERMLERTRLPLYRNALLLLSNSAIVAALGFLFWNLAARLYSPTDVGLASAAISMALFATTLSQLGLPYALVRFAPIAGADRTVLATTVVTVVTVACAGAAAVAAAGIGLWAPTLVALAPWPVLAVALIALAALTGASTALVYVAVSARDTVSALAGGVTHGAVKTVLVLGFAMVVSGAGFEVVLAWLIGTVAAVAVQVALLRTQLAGRIDLRLVRIRDFMQFSVANWLSELAWTAPGLLFPLVVVILLGPEENAYFFIAWAVASLLAAIPTALGSSLLAEGSHAEEETEAHLRRAIVLALPLVTAAIVVFWLAAPLLLNLFGSAYAASGIDTLRWLTLAGLPLSVNLLFLTVARVNRAIGRVLLIALAVGGGSLIAGTFLATSRGAEGIALGYLAVHAIVAIALTSEWLIASARRPAT